MGGSRNWVSGFEREFERSQRQFAGRQTSLSGNFALKECNEPKAN
jgi:hypothetical protein